FEDLDVARRIARFAAARLRWGTPSGPAARAARGSGEKVARGRARLCALAHSLLVTDCGGLESPRRPHYATGNQARRRPPRGRQAARAPLARGVWSVRAVASM